MAPAPLLTTDEYLRTPETLVPSELVYGALRVAESPSVRHQTFDHPQPIRSEVLPAFRMTVADILRDEPGTAA